MQLPPDEITSQGFWEEFWSTVKIPARVDREFKNDRMIAEIFEHYLSHAENAPVRAFEVGCAPGKWLVFLNESLGYSVEGCEYVPSAVERTKENLRACGLPSDPYAVFETDFFDMSIAPSYDIVYSLGFMEHFRNYQAVFERHVGLTLPGGYVVIGYPSFRGINGLIQRSVDKWLESPLLPSHNLDVMCPKILNNLARRSRLESLFLGYVGGFEPALFDLSAIQNQWMRTRDMIDSCRRG
jgi:SAM-dependent methyltransferase